MGEIAIRKKEKPDFEKNSAQYRQNTQQLKGEVRQNFEKSEKAPVR
jgi:hypothetical protein